MNDDELTDRLRRTLQDEAAQVHAPADAWERFQRRAPAPHGRRPWALAAPVAALGLAAAVIALVAVNTGGSHKGTQVQTGTAAAAPPTTATPPTTAALAPVSTAAAASGAASPPPTADAAPSANLPAVQPQSVTFVSPSVGFVLGASTLARTSDAGRTWSALPVPGGWKVSELRFANADDGWAWGAQLWATHDGGHTWHQLVVPGGQGGVYALEAAAGTVHMVVFDGQAFRVATAPVHSDAFTLSLGAPSIPVGGGPVPTIQLVLQGRTGWVVEVDRTVVGGLQLVNGQWQPWTPPCVGTNGPAVLAASSPTELVAACDQGVWGPATPMGERLWVSHDAGSTWTDVGPVPVVPHAEAVASSGGVVAVAGAPEGAGGEEVMTTFDGGRSWTYALRVNGAVSARDLGFTTSSQGVVVLTESGQPGQLWMTRDGGHTWTEVRFS